MIDRPDAVVERPRFEVRIRYGHGVDGVREVFSRYRINAGVQPAVPYMDYPNEVLFKALATILVVGPITAFLNAFAAEAGKAAYARLKEFLRDLRAARGDRVVVLADRDTGVSVRLDDDTSEEALRQLFELDLREFASRGTLTWDARARAWVPRKGRERRSDIFGWFTRDGVVDGSTTWHLVTNLDAAPLVTLCGELLELPQRIEGDQWQWPGRPCMDCVSSDPASSPIPTSDVRGARA